MKASLGPMLLLSILCAIKGYGQSYNFKNLTIDEGLPSNEVYYAIQGENGYLYLSTDRGLQKFDGKEFVTIPFLNSQLDGATVFKTEKDSKGVVWVSTYRYGLFYLDKDTLKPHPRNKEICATLKTSFIDQFAFTSAQNLCFSARFPKNFIYHVSEEAQIGAFTIPSQLMDSSQAYSKQLYLQNDKVFSRKTSFHTEENFNIGPFTSFPARVKDESLMFKDLNNRGTPSLTYKDSVLVGIGNVLLIYSKTGTHINEIRLDHEILSILVDSQNNILVGTYSGFYRVSGKKPPEQHLAGNVINHVFQDNEGGYWFCSTTKGLFYLTSFDIKVLNQSERVLAMSSFNNRLAMIDYSPKISIYSLEENTPRKDTILFVDRAYPDLYFDQNLLGVPHLSYSTDDFKLQSQDVSFPIARGYLKLNDTLILLARSSGAYFYTKDHPVPKLIDSTFFCHSIFADSTFIYLGTDKGVIQYTKENGEYKRLFPKRVNQIITDIKRLNKDVLIIATKTDGLAIINDTSISYFNKDNSNMLNSNCSSIAVENDSVFWVGTDVGVCKFSFSDKGYQSFVIHKGHGLHSHKVNDLEIVDKVLFVATDLGTYYLDIETLQTDDLPIPFRVEISAQYKDEQRHDTIWLKQGVRSITLQLKTSSFKQVDYLTYSCKLNNQENVKTTSNTLFIGQLNSGINEIEMNVADINLNWGREPLKLTIVAPAFYYEKTWFRILAAAFSLSLIVGLVFGYTRLKYQRKLRKLKLDSLELKALNLQLNPHFIFNVIHNLQHLAFNGSRKEASDFITNFSVLTRRILDNSKFKVITLQEEIDNVKLYLELEKMRFKDQPFDFFLEITDEINLKEQFVPPMILQPSIENALWHGLLSKKGHRRLDLYLDKAEGGFKIIIKDNGVGLKKSENRETYLKSKSSVGILNTKTRLQLYEEMEMGSANFNLHEMVDDKGTLGVQVEFYFSPNSNQITMI